MTLCHIFYLTIMTKCHIMNLVVIRQKNLEVLIMAGLSGCLEGMKRANSKNLAGWVEGP